MLKKEMHWFKMLRTKLGTLGALGYLWSRYITGRHPNTKSTETNGQSDIFKLYKFLEFSPFGLPFSDDSCEARSINWLVPDFFVGAGGHLNIFRLVAQLELRGYKCRIVIIGPTNFNSDDEARKAIRTHFFPVEAEVSLGASGMKPAWITVATSWLTAYQARNFRTTKYRCYFIQDFEPYFHARGSEYYFAEASYRWGFYGITAGDWLAQSLAADYGMKAMSMGFSFDRDVYRPMPRRNPEIRRIFFYARPITPRRGFELGLLALNRVAQQLPDVEFILAGWDSSSYHIPFRHINAGNVAVKDLPDLYSQCDAALVLSFTNLSLLPLELMACGCPVVSNKGQNVEWLLNESNSILAEPTPEAIGNQIVSLLGDEGRRKQLITKALAFASSTDWKFETDKVADFFDRLTANDPTGGLK